VAYSLLLNDLLIKKHKDTPLSSSFHPQLPVIPPGLFNRATSQGRRSDVFIYFYVLLEQGKSLYMEALHMEKKIMYFTLMIELCIVYMGVTLIMQLETGDDWVSTVITLCFESALGLAFLLLLILFVVACFRSSRLRRINEARTDGVLNAMKDYIELPDKTEDQA